METAEPCSRRAERLGLFLLVAAAAIVLVPLRHRGLIVNDEGFLLHPALRMQAGEVLYRDIWVHYAPLRYHLLELLLEGLGPSLAVERGMLLAMLLASVAGLYRLTLRFAPPVLAWIPGAAYALAPGPWHKVPYTLCTVVFFLALARTLECTRRVPLLALGVAIGATLATRQDLGLAQLGLGLAAVAWQRGLALDGRLKGRVGSALCATGLVGLGGLLPILPLAAFYGAHGALADLVEAVFVRGFFQAGASPAHFTWRLLAPRTFGEALEGAVAGKLLLSAVFAYVFATAAWAWRWRRSGFDLLGTSLLAYAFATLPQGFVPPMVVRFLQSATPLYVLATAGLASLAAALGGSRSRLAAAALGGIGVAGIAASVIFLVPVIYPDDAYTGSWRMGRFDATTRVLETNVWVDSALADDIRSVREFLAEHDAGGQWLFAANAQSLWYPILGRDNPTAYVFERKAAGDFVFSSERKRREVERLLASEVRYALVGAQWWFPRYSGDAVRRTLREHFAPVREYGRVLILRRTRDPAWLGFNDLLRRLRHHRPLRAGELARLEALVAANPEEPLPLLVLADRIRPPDEPAEPGRGILALLERAASLDPHDVRLLERLARLHLERGDLDRARDALDRAARVRDSKEVRRLRALISGRKP